MLSRCILQQIIFCKRKEYVFNVFYIALFLFVVFRFFVSRRQKKYNARALHLSKTLFLYLHIIKPITNLESRFQTSGFDTPTTKVMGFLLPRPLHCPKALDLHSLHKRRLYCSVVPQLTVFYSQAAESPFFKIFTAAFLSRS